SKTQEFKDKIKASRADIDQRITELKAEAEASTDIDRNEDIYTEVDSLKEKGYEITEKVLAEILPEAFAVVKETAKRFTNNTTITVTASEFDRTLSATKDYVKLENDKAVWKNSWDAAGKEVTWDMIHYDVQLIGGISLHQG